MTICEDEPGKLVANDDPIACPFCLKTYQRAAHMCVNRAAMQVHEHSCLYCEETFETVRIDERQILVRP
jgi:hypothetical protein